MDLAAEARALAKELGITVTELARRTGQSPANLSKKLTKKTLSFEDFEKLLQAMGVQPEFRFILPGGEAREPDADARLRDQLRILEQQLAVERLKSQYFATARHGLRTALDSISGGITLAERHSRDPERVRGSLTRIRPALDELEKLIADDPFNREMGTADAPASPPEESGPTALPGKRVLLAEDNELDRSIMRELLEDTGMRVETAATGTQAVMKVMEAAPDRYDAVLMDLLMPEMDGFQAASIIRGLPDPGKAHIPIIAVTASVSPDERQRAAAAGMNDFLEKPLRLEKLYGILKDTH